MAYSQLIKIRKLILKRKKIAIKYNYFFKNYIKEIKFRQINNKIYSSWHLYIAIFDFKKIKSSKEKLLKYLLKKGIVAQQHYIPIYKFSYYKNKIKEKYFGAEKYYKTSLSLPIYYDLSNKDVDYINFQLYKFFKKNEK